MKRNPAKRIQSGFTTWAACALVLGSSAAFGSIDRGISAVSDTEWEKILETKGALEYEIKKGDTLADISTALFGSPKYWPKIWALNQDRIMNPHLIQPGVKLAFNMGSATSLPSMQISGESKGAPSAAAALGAPTNPNILAVRKNRKTDDEIIRENVGVKKARKKEWMTLPTQAWESESKYQMPIGFDEHGIDMNSRATFNAIKGLALPYTIRSEKFTPVGEIVASRTEALHPSLTDIVYVRPDGEVQVGQTYGLTQEPFLLKSRKSDRVGFSYLNIGAIKIIGVKDGLFVGSIEALADVPFRGTKLIPLPKKVFPLEPVPGPRALEGILTLDKTRDTFSTAQFKQVFVDKGTEDGLTPGMIFRAYQYFDPATDKRITNSDFIVESEIMVVQCSEEYSTGLVINGRKDLQEGSLVVLQTDVSEFRKKGRAREKIVDDGSGSVKKDPLDELDSLGGSDQLGKDEEKELKQLENWDENPESENPETGSDALDAEAAPLPETAPLEGQMPPEAMDPGQMPPPDSQMPPAPEGIDSMPPPDAELPGAETGASGEELPPLPPPEEEAI
ncbi:MAG: LysM peptidoglycan-binding domain-containing protein [Bdellovibrionales bacterium]|nr:LysM peptidoglycan-binding domain-containing protein [Bdellovibrionales bacterium]